MSYRRRACARRSAGVDVDEARQLPNAGIVEAAVHPRVEDLGVMVKRQHRSKSSWCETQRSPAMPGEHRAVGRRGRSPPRHSRRPGADRYPLADGKGNRIRPPKRSVPSAPIRLPDDIDSDLRRHGAPELDDGAVDGILWQKSFIARAAGRYGSSSISSCRGRFRRRSGAN